MATCPDGHETASTDFCDVCGLRLDGVASSAAASAPAAASTPAAAGNAPTGIAEQAATGASSPAREKCPNCGAERTGKFCEACGLDFSSGTIPPSGPAAAAISPDPDPAEQQPQSSPPAPGPGWTAVVTADRDYFDQVVADGGPDAGAIQFPAYCPERRFRLTGPQMRIGRRSASRGIEPEIDLTGPPEDTGVSHMHAVLIAEPDGTWALVDPGSSNGTQLNGAEIATGAKVPLHDGDRISLGGWTVLTIQAS